MILSVMMDEAGLAIVKSRFAYIILPTHGVREQNATEYKLVHIWYWKTLKDIDFDDQNKY